MAVPRSSAAGSPGGRTGYAPMPPAPPIRPRPAGSIGWARCCAASPALSTQTQSSEGPRPEKRVTAAHPISDLCPSANDYIRAARRLVRVAAERDALRLVQLKAMAVSPWDAIEGVRQSL